MRKLTMLVGASRSGSSFIYRSWFENFRTSEKYFVPTIKEMQFLVNMRSIERRKALEEQHIKRHGNLLEKEIKFINNYINVITLEDYINLWPNNKISFDCTPNHCLATKDQIQTLEPYLHSVGFVMRNPFTREISAIKRLLDYRERYRDIDPLEHINFQRNISNYDNIVKKWSNICKDRFQTHFFENIGSLDWVNNFNRKLQIDTIESVSNFCNESIVSNIPKEYIQELKTYNLEHVKKMQCITNEIKDKWLEEISAYEYA